MNGALLTCGLVARDGDIVMLWYRGGTSDGQPNNLYPDLAWPKRRPRCWFLI